MKRHQFAATCLAGWTICCAWGAPATAQAPVFSEVEPGQARSLSANSTNTLARIQRDRSTRSVTIVRVDRDMLRTGRDVSVQLNLRANLNLNARPLAVETTSGERFSWTGEIAPNADAPNPLPPGKATIVINGANATGTIQTPDGKLFKLQPIGDGTNALIEVDRSGMPPDHQPGPPLTPRPKTQNEDRPPSAARDAIAGGPAVMDIVVAYTKRAKEATDIDSLIDLAVIETNQAFVNSQVAASVRVTHKIEYDYADNSRPDETCAAPNFACPFTRIVDDFGGSGDGQMDSIHTLRNQFGGDLAVLIVDNREACGRAYDIGADAKTAFVAVHWNCATGYYSFAHEIGHLAGARHDVAHDSGTTPFAFGHGFIKSKPNGGWRTIMSYSCEDGSCDERKPYWSNPFITFDGSPMGTEAAEHNARVWSERAAALADFRPSVTQLGSR
jgi:hypothetical protein